MLYNLFNFQSNDNRDTDGLYWYNKFYTKKPVWTSLNQFHGLQKTGPRWSGSVPTISGSVLDWLRFMVANFGGKKLDWTGLANTTCLSFPKNISSKELITSHLCTDGLNATNIVIRPGITLFGFAIPVFEVESQLFYSCNLSTTIVVITHSILCDVQMYSRYLQNTVTQANIGWTLASGVVTSKLSDTFLWPT